MSSKYPVIWRLRECMRAAQIESVTDLYRRIKAIDPEAVKYAQLARIIDKPPVRLNLQTLAVLTIVLCCRVSDILDVHTGSDSLAGRFPDGYPGK